MLKIKSIRFRLTLWYSLAFFISTAIVFAAFYFINRQTLLYQTDRAITSHAETLIKIITDDQPSMMDGVFNQGIISQQFAEMPGMLVLITNAGGQISASSQTGADTNPIIKDLIEKSANIIKPTFVERQIGTTTLRIGIFPIVQNNSTYGLVFMGDPVEAIYHSLNTLILTLMSVYFLFSVPTIVGSYFLAKSALNPIQDISTELKTITDRNLNTRVEIPKTSDEVAELAATFNDLLKRLHEAFYRERQFIGDVAHELKTPVATLRGEIEIALSKNRSNEEYKKTLTETLTDVDRLSATIKNILDLAWIHADSVNLTERHFNLSDVMTELLEIASKLASQKRIIVQSEIQPNILIGGLEDKISRAILNILDNAIKYTPNGGTVSITLTQKQLMARIEVKDTGVGIPKEEQPHIFDRFYRGSRTTKTLGSGLGLAIARGIIKAHGGKITVTSKQNQGTTANLSLPLWNTPQS